MQKVTLITGEKGKGKTTRLHECLSQHKNETQAVLSPANVESAAKAQLKKTKVIGVETTTIEELEAVVTAASSCESKFYVTTPLEVKNQLSKAELENFQVIEVAITLP